MGRSKNKAPTTEQVQEVEHVTEINEIEQAPTTEQVQEVDESNKPSVSTCKRIAKGKSVTCLKGVVGEGQIVDESYFDSKEVFENLVTLGYIVDGPA